MQGDVAPGLKHGYNPKVSLSLRVAPALPSPLVSEPSQHGPASSPNRCRQGPPRAVNPTEWPPLSGQELKGKILQAFTAALIRSFNQPLISTARKKGGQWNLPWPYYPPSMSKNWAAFLCCLNHPGPQVGLSYFLIRVSKSVWFSHNSQQPGARACASTPFSGTCHFQHQANLYVAMASPFICLYILWTAWIYHIIFIWKTENGGFIAIQSDYCRWFLYAFLPYFNQKGSVSLYSALDLHYICKDLVWVVIPLLTMTRVDLPKNKSKLCQTLSLCFWFGTTKWITEEIFRVHTASIALNLKQELNKLNRGPCQRFTFSIMGEGLSSLCLCILWLYRDNEATGVFPSCSEHCPLRHPSLRFSSIPLPAPF